MELDNKRDEHVCRRLVVGIRDKELTQKFQLAADLTLASKFWDSNRQRYINCHTNTDTFVGAAVTCTQVKTMDGWNGGRRAEKQEMYYPILKEKTVKEKKTLNSAKVLC